MGNRRMDFLAGIVGANGILEPMEKKKFLVALGLMDGILPCKIQVIESRWGVFSVAGASCMWQGPNHFSGKGWAVATGLQSRPIRRNQYAIEFLIEQATRSSQAHEDCFDSFSLAHYDQKTHCLTLMTDPLGISPIYWMETTDSLVFSSHQTFLRLFQDRGFQPDLQGVMEYLVIGHNIGDKCLIKGVRVLPPGCLLRSYGGRWKIEKYRPMPSRGSENMSVSEAVELVVGCLKEQVEAYSEVAGPETPVACFLSGGWDSRLLAALFKVSGHLALTYTTQQQTRFNGRLISEKAIAREVADLLGVENKFILPEYRTPDNALSRAILLDFTTWFHDWAFSMVERVPEKKYLLVDGLLGDILLRGLYVSTELEKSLKHGPQETAEVFYQLYENGFNPYTRSLRQWGMVLSQELLSDFSSALRGDIRAELESIFSAADPVSIFLIQNRSRRGISPLPRLLFGSKGEVLMPFCQPGFLRLALSIPLEIRKSPRFYEAILDSVKEGLGRIVSTNTRDPERLKPFLVDSITDLIPERQARERAARALKERAWLWTTYIVENPPESVLPFLQPEIRKGILKKDMGDVRKNLYFLERLIILDGFMRGSFVQEEIN